MTDIHMRIVNLQPMRVISFNGFGESPEGQALDKLFNWSISHHKKGRVFGFNNPNPSLGSPDYGYEVWMAVDQEIEVSDEAQVVDFPGGQYAVLRCSVRHPWEDIPGAWQRLVSWLESSEYQRAPHQWLEEHLDPENAKKGDNFALDLYLPIQE